LEGVPLVPNITSAQRFREKIQAFVKELPSKITENIFSEASMPAFVDYRAVNNLTIVWKSIESLGRIGTIVRLVPDVRTVVLIRNPCGYAASVLRGESQGKFVSSTPTSDDWGVFEQLVATPQADAKGVTLAMIKRLQPIERLAWRWLIFNEKAIEDLEGQVGCKVVRYEDLCKKPEEVTRMLFKHANLTWSDQTWEFIRRSIGTKRAGYYSVFKDPVQSAHRWEKELAANDVKRIFSIVKDSKAGQLYPFEYS
jgi:hypothetical protein